MRVRSGEAGVNVAGRVSIVAIKLKPSG